MRLFDRRGGVPAEVVARAGLPRSEKVLASAEAADGTWLIGTRRSLVLVLPSGVEQLPWEEVEDAAWDNDGEELRITGVGSYGEPRPSYAFTMADPALLLQLVRERVTASIVLQRRYPVRGRLGLTVIGRRSPAGGDISWMHAYDPGLEPDDPEARTIAEAALAEAQAEVGEGPADRADRI